MLAYDHIEVLKEKLRTGDVVFIRVRARPFLEVSEATGSWTNHVGVAIRDEDGQLNIAESTFPLSRMTTFERFIARSENGRVAVSRLRSPLLEDEKKRLNQAALMRMNVWYDTGFDLRSNRQFCSRFVHEVLEEATGIKVGEIERFSTLLARRPESPLGFWRLWYFGRIPWERETVTPASVLASHALEPLFDGALSDRHVDAINQPA